MNRKLLKQLEQQFGGNWACACRTPFDPGRFEIITENYDSFLAHYICAVCGREQMLAATIKGEEKTRITPLPLSLRAEAISTNDVLDIRAEIKKAPLNRIKSWLKTRPKEVSGASTDVDTLLRFSKD